MIAARRTVGLVVALVVIAGRATAQETDTTLSAAWLAEHLRRAPSAARDAYEAVVRSEAEDTPSRAIAAARLVEIHRVLGDADAVRRQVRILGRLLRSAQGAAVAISDLPRDGLRDALDLPEGTARDAALAAARRALWAALDAERTPARSIVPVVARRLAADRDAETERLERELAAATTRGDVPAIRELRERLRSIRGSRSTGVDRERAWRVLAVRSLTEGRFELAEKLLERLPRVDGQVAPSDRLERALARGDLDRRERDALDDLARQITRWRSTGSPDADRALALLPY